MTPDTKDRIAALSLAHLRQVVAIDSQSDEFSETIPTTEGQRVLSAHLRGFFEGLGAKVETDDFANIIASLPGRGAGADARPVAMMVHLDTARGTEATDALQVLPAWDGRPVPYAENPNLRVDDANYPDTAEFLGQSLVFGPGRAPFGLDDKLGLTHLMTLATLLRDTPDAPHPPLLIVGRPDEEVGRMAAVEGLAELLAARGVAFGYTIDGILPFEVNVANFNAAMASVAVPTASLGVCPPDRLALRLALGGVNTHGATAKAEGHRSALRFAAELLGRLAAQGLADQVRPVGFTSDALRDCDGLLDLWVAPGARDATLVAAGEVVRPHLDRGASLEVSEGHDSADSGVEPLLGLVAAFIASEPGFPLLCEESAGWEGYSAPVRVRREDDTLWLDVRLRDFDPAGLERRITHVKGMAGGREVSVVHQYVNMGPELAKHPELARWAVAAGADLGLDVRDAPIRGGTGVDPFLARGVPVANLGTGYFAPESEKELTSLEMMADHARWLLALLARLAVEAPRA